MNRDRKAMINKQVRNEAPPTPSSTQKLSIQPGNRKRILILLTPDSDKSESFVY
jgi:hypothetical protein